MFFNGIFIKRYFFKFYSIRNISSVRLIFNIPVEIALAVGDQVGVPDIAWMGN
jgi:hypothetical protein